MKALIWKEWRENLQWAALACLTCCLPTLNALFQRTLVHKGPSADGFLDTVPLLMVLSPFFAAALGLLQVGPELRRDQWAFLIHRPVSRSFLFAGKVIAGLSMYGAAMLIPLSAALLVRSPQPSLAAKDLEILPTALIHLLTGVAFYFGGMLTAVRPARWYGSRVYGFFAAIVCLTMATIQYSVSGRILTPLWLIPIIGLAAWGSFLTTGSYLRQPCLAKVALGVTLYMGVAVVMGAVSAFAIGAVESVTHDSAAMQSIASRLEAPPAALVLIYLWPTYLPSEIAAENVPQVQAAALSTLGYTLLASLAVAPITFLVAKRASLSKKAIWGWTAATLALGVSGIFLLLALREWPARVACPNCHKKRSVGNELCEHCGAPFPRPVPDETWIFEAENGATELAGILDAA